MRISGHERASKARHVALNKVPFVAAVQTSDKQLPVAMHLRRVNGFRKSGAGTISANRAEELRQHRMGRRPGLLPNHKGVGCQHAPIAAGGGREAAQPHYIQLSEYTAWQCLDRAHGYLLGDSRKIYLSLTLPSSNRVSTAVLICPPSSNGQSILRCRHYPWRNSFTAWLSNLRESGDV